MVFCETNGKKYFDDRLIHFLKREECMPLLHLIESIPVNELIDCYDTTLLHLAAKHNNVLIMKYLIGRGCEINVVNKCNTTPLIMAVTNESVEAVKLLLDANANIYLSCFYGKSALKIAMGFRKTPRSLSIVKLFFKKITLDLAANCFDDVEIVEKLRKANCPLYRVIYLNNAEVTKIMIDRKYNSVNCQDPDTGNTALHEAVNQRDLRNILVLLESGADIGIKNHKGQSPSVHKFANNVEILRALLKTNIAWTEPDESDNEVMKLGEVLGKGTKETVQLFLQNYYIDFKIRDNFERTPLHYLAENSNADVLELFENAEFDVNAVDKGNYAALHYAVFRGDPGTVQFILERDADVNIQGYLGCTPLFYAVMQMTFESQRKKKCIELLMLYGADPEFQKDEETVIGIAQRNGMPHLIEPVLAHFALLESEGKPISKKNWNRIEPCKVTKNYYELCKMDIKRMKEDKIYGSLNTYRALTLNVYVLSRYVQIPEVSNRFAKEEFDCNSYYNQILKRRYNKAVEILRLRKIAILIVSDAIDVFDADHVIIEMIVSFLNYEDLQRLT